MLFQFSKPIIETAERMAGNGEPLDAILAQLRKLSLDNFGELLFSMPNAEWPALSRALPAMAPVEVQKRWTGQSGYDLLKSTTAFARQIENNVYRLGKRPKDCRYLDFGCGYGRFVRMLYYFTDPSRIYAVDAWDKSLATCREAGLVANFLKSDSRPDELPVGDVKFDIAFAFSIFTHLSKQTAEACLSAVRRHIADDGLFLLTIRPVEYWAFRDKLHGTNDAERMIAAHKQGYAYTPQNGPEAEHYGETSVPLEFFNQAGWSVAGCDTTLHDSYQISVLLRPA